MSNALEHSGRWGTRNNEWILWFGRQETGGWPGRTANALFSQEP